MLYHRTDLIGYLGVFMILLAYSLLQLQHINKDKYLYSWLNLIGSALILYSLYFNWNWPSVIIEIAWILISGYGLFRIFKMKKNQSH